MWITSKKTLKSYNIIWNNNEIGVGKIIMISKIKEVLKYTTQKLKRGYENDINIEKIEEMKKQGTVIIDVRSEQEFKEGHIEGAISIPEYEIENRIKNEIPYLDQTIVVYCGTGHRSKRAQKLLEKIGYNNVYNLENGWQNYWDFKISMLKLYCYI